MSYNKLGILILIMILSGHASVLSQPIHKDSINRKMTGYYQVYNNLNSYENIYSGFLRKGKREGFWTETTILYLNLNNDTFGYSKAQGFYKNDKKVGFWYWYYVIKNDKTQVRVSRYKRLFNREIEYIYLEDNLKYKNHFRNFKLIKSNNYQEGILKSQTKFKRYSKISKYFHYKVIVYDSCGRIDSILNYIEDRNLNTEIGVNNYTFKHGWSVSYDYSAGIIRKEKYIRGERVKQKESRFHYRK